MLGFITHSNKDDLSFRNFEITACGSFLLSQRSSMQERIFRENIEAIYFNDVEDCASKIHHFLIHSDERETIANKGYKRSLQLGLDNDFVIKRAFLKLFR